MLQYLVILLDDAAASFCHYASAGRAPRPMPANVLRRGIRFAMTENLNVQFVYPAGEVPADVAALVESVDHVKIKPAGAPGPADVVVCDGFDRLPAGPAEGVTYVLRTDRASLFDRYGELAPVLTRAARLNVVLTDVERFADADAGRYAAALDALAALLTEQYAAGRTPQLNVLTDRLLLTGMNNCGAGETCLTLAPDGRFYVCPAFYYAPDATAVGSLGEGPDVPNPQLYRLDHAPLCRRCDAWQCRRCVWLNRRTTLEVNTPGHEQCVAAHVEREASRRLLERMRAAGIVLPGAQEIKKLDYLDPFDVRETW